MVRRRGQVLRRIAAFSGILLLSTFLLPVGAQIALLLTVSIDRELGPAGETIIISGKVTDPKGSPVGNAQISIQVNNPNGGSVHVALTYSKSDGTYIDRFVLPSNLPAGNYTVYVIGSKPGFRDVGVQLSFSISLSDFTISTSPSSLKLKQGESASVRVTLSSESYFGPPVALTVAGLPSEVTSRFSSDHVSPPAIVTLEFNTSRLTRIGSYNVTILAKVGDLVRSASVLLIVGQAEPDLGESLWGWPIAVATLMVVAAVGLGAWARRRSVSLGLPRPGKELPTDQEYLAMARALAKLEELKAKGRVDEKTYLRLRSEYEKRLAGQGKSAA